MVRRSFALKSFYVFVGLICITYVQAQDDYHTGVLAFLKSNYNLDNPTYLYNDNEAANRSELNFYGNVSRSFDEASNLDFSLLTNIKVNSAGNNAWDAGANVRNKSSIVQGDAIVLTFWAKENSMTSEIFPFLENATSFDKEFYQLLELTPDWTQYFVPVIAGSSYAANRMTFGFHLASVAQDFDLAGLTVFNFGQGYDIKDLPSSFGQGYQGSEDDAPWRAEAAMRIEDIRKSEIQIKVIDNAGNPVEGAQISLDMQAHEYGFGSALVTCRFPGNSCYDATYVEKVSNLDGEGHGFNVAVTENDLKWDAWEEQWFSTPAQNIKAIEYLADKDITMRGHTLVWPGFSNMPDDISDNRDNLPYLRERISGRINTMISDPTLGPLVEDWDVLNEITTNRDLENSFKNDPNFTTGRELYREIFKQVKEANSNTKLYVNDFIVLSGGGSTQTTLNRYKSFLDEINSGDVKIDGIGFQAHIGPSPTSILKVKEVFDEYSTRYNARIKVTEYDISPNVDPEIQAKYLSDFLTMTFSHPASDAFLMWGFWDENHWKGNAPMFDKNWNLKLSGQAFIDRVFKDWWSNETAISNDLGSASIRAYKGKHKITVEKDGILSEGFYSISTDQQVVVQLDITSSTKDLEQFHLNLYPNPTSDGVVKFIFDQSLSPLDLNVFTVDGRLIKSIKNVKKGKDYMLTSDIGLYILQFKNESTLINRKLIIE